MQFCDEYRYDLSNRLISVKKSSEGTDGLKAIASYVYDIRGLRVESIKTGSKDAAEEDGRSASDSGTTTYYQYGLDGELLWTDDGTTQEKYIYAHATIWAEVRTTDGKSATYYHHTDHTGTTECITDTLGKVVWEASYEAYGRLVHENGTVSFKASFTGKQVDEDTGLYYFNARWYDAELGRFVTEDPARDGTNWYEYCRNNPLKYMDPTGLDDEEINKKNEGSEATATSTTTTSTDDDDDDTLKALTTSTTTSASSLSTTTTAGAAPTVSTINESTTTQDSSNGQTKFQAFIDPLLMAGNGDFGADYKRMADSNLQSGHFGLAGIQYVDSCLEMTLDVLAAYGGAAAVGHVVSSLSATSGATEVVAAGKGGKSIVLGEGMGRVKDAAKNLQTDGVNAKWYQAWSKNFPTDRAMSTSEFSSALARNERWLTSKIKEGYQVFDIGIDATRATRSPFYQLEQSILQKFNYPVTSLGK